MELKLGPASKIAFDSVIGSFEAFVRVLQFENPYPPRRSDLGTPVGLDPQLVVYLLLTIAAGSAISLFLPFAKANTLTAITFVSQIATWTVFATLTHFLCIALRGTASFWCTSSQCFAVLGAQFVLVNVLTLVVFRYGLALAVRHLGGDLPDVFMSVDEGIEQQAQSAQMFLMFAIPTYIFYFMAQLGILLFYFPRRLVQLHQLTSWRVLAVYSLPFMYVYLNSEAVLYMLWTNNPMPDWDVMLS